MPEPLKATAGTTAYSGVNRASHSLGRESPAAAAAGEEQRRNVNVGAREGGREREKEGGRGRGPSFQICKGMNAMRGEERRTAAAEAASFTA